MKPCVRGKSIFFREVLVDDAAFIVDLRTDPKKAQHLSATSKDVLAQTAFISSYRESLTDFYFVICDWKWTRLGTIRIYDIRGSSFCWGSWILAADAPTHAAVESALLLYDFAFFSLHYPKAHFDVRKQNVRVVQFHKRFGASVVDEDDANLYFEYDVESYMKIRQKYHRFLP